MEERDRAGLRALQDCEGGESNQERERERDYKSRHCVYIYRRRERSSCGLSVWCFQCGNELRSQSSAGVCMGIGALASSYVPRKSFSGTVDLIKDSSTFFF